MNSHENKKTGLLSRFSLEDKVAIVTGGGKGVGRGIALGLADAGAHVVVVARTASAIEQTASQIRSKSRRALPITADVTDHQQVDTMVQKAVEAFGRIDILVNNVGGVRRYRFSPIETPIDVWNEIIALNLTSTFLCTQKVARVMIEKKIKGSIVNISSRAGSRGQVRVIAYGAAKAGINHFTTCMSSYLAKYGIRINGVSAGRMDTEGTHYLGAKDDRIREYYIPLNRLGQPEDIALAAIYLASDASAYVTGITVNVEGGDYLGGLNLEMAEKAWNKAKQEAAEK